MTHEWSGIGTRDAHWQPHVRKECLDLEPALFQPLGELEGLTQRLQGFIDREPWRIGGNLQKDTTGLAKVHRMEIIPVDYRRDVEAKSDELRPNVGLCSASTREEVLSTLEELGLPI